jgi:hypothetical protein
MKARQWILVGLFFLPGIICAQVEKGNMSTIRGKQVFSKSGERVRYDTASQQRTRYVTEMITPRYRVQKKGSHAIHDMDNQQLIQKALEEGGRWEVNENGDTIIETPRWKVKRLHEKSMNK